MSAYELDPIGIDREPSIARTFVQMVDTLHDEFDADVTMTHLTRASCRLLGDVEASVATRNDNGDVAVRAASSARKAHFDQVQIDQRRGPIVDACRNGVRVVGVPFCPSSSTNLQPREVSDISRLADVFGFSAYHSIPLRRRETIVGVLSVVETASVNRSYREISLLQALADSATIGILNRRALAESNELSRQLQSALTSRIQIEQSKGMLAALLEISIDAAFEILRRYARRHGERLHDVAARVINGELEPAALIGEPVAADSRLRRKRVPISTGDLRTPRRDRAGSENGCC